MRLAVWILLAAASAHAQRSSASWVRCIWQAPYLLLELGPGATGPAERVELRLSKAAARGAVLEYAPQGWAGRVDGAALQLEGPGLRTFPALYRIRLAAAKPPPLARLRAFIAGERVAARDAPVEQAPPPAVSDSLDGLLALPAVAATGETVLGLALIPQATPPVGAWSFDGANAAIEGARLRIHLPEDAAGPTRFAVVYRDPWNRVTVRGEWNLRIEPHAVRTRRPRVDSMQPVALVGEAITVCGWFPRGAISGLLLDGKPQLEAAGGSSRSLVLSLPEALPPGRHFISGDPERGFPDRILPFRAIRLDTTVDRAMQPPQVRLKAVGTEAPVRIRAVNLNPYAAALIGGESQIVETDGGLENIATIGLRPSAFPIARPGNLNVVFTLAEDRLACAEPGVSPTSSSGARVAH